MEFPPFTSTTTATTLAHDQLKLSENSRKKVVLLSGLFRRLRAGFLRGLGRTLELVFEPLLVADGLVQLTF